MMRDPNLHHAKLAMLLLLASLAAGTGCNGESPTSPTVDAPEVPRKLGHVYGTVYAPPEGCLVGATIEVLDGSQAGQRVQQGADDCSSNDGRFRGYSFRLRDLPLGRTARIRVSMAGFQSQEKSVVPLPDYLFAYDFEVDFELVRSP